MWSAYYEKLANRNIGLLTREQQDKLKNACVAVCGLGGLGGIIAEILARTGIESFRLLDNGTFEASNLNRQIFCFQESLGRYKTDVTEEFLKKINPDIRIIKEREITENNVEQFLNGVDVVALTIDSILPVLLLSGSARRQKIPLVEGWAVAYGNVRVFTHETPSVEEVYKFPTLGKPLSELTPQLAKELMFQSVLSLQSIEGLNNYYPPSAAQRLLEKGEGTTLAPMVWLTCVMMAMEVFKILLNWGNLALAPHFALYDGFVHRIPQQHSDA